MDAEVTILVDFYNADFLTRLTHGAECPQIACIEGCRVALFFKVGTMRSTIFPPYIISNGKQ